MKNKALNLLCIMLTASAVACSSDDSATFSTPTAERSGAEVVNENENSVTAQSLANSLTTQVTNCEKLNTQGTLSYSKVLAPNSIGRDLIQIDDDKFMSINLFMIGEQYQMEIEVRQLNDSDCPCNVLTDLNITMNNLTSLEADGVALGGSSGSLYALISSELVSTDVAVEQKNVAAFSNGFFVTPAPVQIADPNTFSDNENDLETSEAETSEILGQPALQLTQSFVDGFLEVNGGNILNSSFLNELVGEKMNLQAEQLVLDPWQKGQACQDPMSFLSKPN